MFGIDDAIIGSAGLGAVASLYGANQQSRSANAANALASQEFWQTQGNLQPYMQAGTTALSDLQSRLPALTTPFGMQQFQASPAYQFNLDQGKQAIDKAAASRGAYYQPATLQDISRFSQGLASNEFQNAFNNYWGNNQNQFNMLSGVANSGQNAAAGLGGFGANYAQNAGNNITGMGNAQAAGAVGAANAITGGVSSLYNNYLMQQLLARNQQPVLSQQGGMMGGFGGDMGMGGVA